LHIAAQENRLDVVKLLIRSKADLTQKNQAGMTAAALANVKYNTEIVQILSSPSTLRGSFQPLKPMETETTSSTSFPESHPLIRSMSLAIVTKEGTVENYASAVIRVSCAKGIRSNNLLVAQSCYVQIKLGRFTMQSETKKRAGTEPVWNEDFAFDLTPNTFMDVAEKDLNMVQFGIFSQHMFYDVLLAIGRVKLQKANDKWAKLFLPVKDSLSQETTEESGELQYSIKLS